MAIRINRVYTRTGDKGETRLVGDPKDHATTDLIGKVRALPLD